MVYERFRLLASAEKYLRNISESERARIDADMYAMSLGDESQVKTKQLRGAIRELIQAVTDSPTLLSMEHSTS